VDIYRGQSIDWAARNLPSRDFAPAPMRINSAQIQALADVCGLCSFGCYLERRCAPAPVKRHSEGVSRVLRFDVREHYSEGNLLLV
jgi:hypothetical protein